jgi:AcrR family transcriptional regulator
MTNSLSDLVASTEASVQAIPPALDVPLGARSKQERILDAALLLFARRGYQATAVPEIANAAGVATGTIYRYFDTKDALLNALYQRWRGELNAHVLAPTRDGLSSRQLFGVMWRRIAEWFVEYPVQAAFLEQHYHKPLLDEKSREADRIFIAVMERFVTDAKASGDVRDMRPTLAVALIWGGALGMLKMVGDGHLDADAPVIAQAEASLWDALRS